MFTRWLPWKWLIRRAARSYGVVDPFMLLARLRRFAVPSEVEIPPELLRAWTAFQARGVVNARAIQHNLDWVWPYWVERQFNPRDSSFVPRGFSLTHINLTHRNWTAVCVPGADVYSLVDPRGLVTAIEDGWSLDAWVVDDDAALIPSRCADASQVMRHDDQLVIETELRGDGLELKGRVEMVRGGGGPELVVDWNAEAGPRAFLCVSLRPYNPEGIQFIDRVKTHAHVPGWLVNRRNRVLFDRAPARFVASTYGAGDVFNRLQDHSAGEDAECKAGMVTAAAMFPVDKDGTARVRVTVPLAGNVKISARSRRPEVSWRDLDDMCPKLDVPDERITYLFRAAARALMALSAGEVYPGPYTYRRFWFRDACIMLHALLALNQGECCRRAFEESFPGRQTSRGFYRSQQGEWDSNGQVLWLAGRYDALAGSPLEQRFLDSLRKGADWLCRKRLSGGNGRAHAGLLPPGISAEHLGPNNFYYWDNFWGLAGLRAASGIFRHSGDRTYAARLAETADDYEQCIFNSIDRVAEGRCGGAIPAAPDRRMDAGAIGSLAADYPLRILAPGDPRIMKTAEFLLDNCIIEDGFFHDMTHSGINPYLTLHLAQVLLRANDGRYAPLVRRVAALASPTGQWPEAVHPFTGGGCMGDGQHGWAAAEWVLIVRALFVREEEDRLVIGSGLLPEWLERGEPLRFGPTPTGFGRITVTIEPGKDPPRAVVRGRWHGRAPEIAARIPGFSECVVETGAMR